MEDGLAAAGEEPEAKRARVESEEPALNPKKKRKVALFLAYLGKGYSGMQRNPGTTTIEEALEEAIWRAGGISDDNRGKFTKVSWMRAARTDKGVSAVGQVVSLKMVIKPDGIVERINQHLPDQIRALGIKRVTSGFDARKLCDRRRYEYVIPLFALDPEQCREKSYYEQKGSPLQYGLTHDIKFTAEIRDGLNRILQKYVGTHNFHNFTQGIGPNEPQALRNVLSFTVGEPFEINGRGFVACTVLGQSFVLHQIRKMIGLALAVFRGVAPESCVEEAYKKDVFVNVPLAPELGLFLVEAIFDSYNKRFGHIHEHLNMKEYELQTLDFKKSFIYKHVAQTEEDEKTMATWLRSLNDRNFKFSKWENSTHRKRHVKQNRSPATVVGALETYGIKPDANAGLDKTLPEDQQEDRSIHSAMEHPSISQNETSGSLPECQELPPEPSSATHLSGPQIEGEKILTKAGELQEEPLDGSGSKDTSALDTITSPQDVK